MEKHKDLNSHDQAILDVVEEKLTPLRAKIATLEQHVDLMGEAIAAAIIEDAKNHREGAAA